MTAPAPPGAPLPFKPVGGRNFRPWCAVPGQQRVPPSPVAMTKHLAIVPAYNEAGAVGATVARPAPARAGLRRAGRRRRLDGRHGASVARGAGATVIQLPFNLGIGGAVQTGYQYALEHGYDVAVQVDGDGQHDARHIHELLGHLRATRELEHGHRVALPGRRRTTATARRCRAGSGIRIFAARPVDASSGGRVTDPTSGFRMVDRRGIELFARDYPHDYPEVEAVAAAALPPARGRRDAGADAPAHDRRVVDQPDAARSTT